MAHPLRLPTARQPQQLFEPCLSRGVRLIARLSIPRYRSAHRSPLRPPPLRLDCHRIPRHRDPAGPRSVVSVHSIPAARSVGAPLLLHARIHPFPSHENEGMVRSLPAHCPAREGGYSRDQAIAPLKQPAETRLRAPNSLTHINIEIVLKEPHPIHY